MGWHPEERVRVCQVFPWVLSPWEVLGSSPTPSGCTSQGPAFSGAGRSALCLLISLLPSRLAKKAVLGVCVSGRGPLAAATHAERATTQVRRRNTWRALGMEVGRADPPWGRGLVLEAMVSAERCGARGLTKGPIPGHFLYRRWWGPNAGSVEANHEAVRSP